MVRDARLRRAPPNESLTEKAANASALSVMAGLVPAIHVFLAGGDQERGCPAQGRA